MPALQVSLALNPGPLTRPLLDGETTAEGVEWAATALHPSEMFWRQLHFGDFDISEMSLASLLQAVAKGERDWVGLPVFTTRHLCHTDIIVRTDAGIESPADLAGRRVGVPEYQQTSAVWSRGVLADEHGVDPAGIAWHMERGGDTSHAAGTGFTPPEGVRIEQIPPSESIGSLLAAGELDASLLYLSDGNLIDRSPGRATLGTRVRRLFDPAAETARYLRTAGFRHATHCVVIRAELADAHPWLALNLYAAFERAKRLVAERAAAALAPWTPVLPGAADTRRDLAATDPWPSGVAGQRDMLATLCRYAHDQGLTQRLVDPGELFADRTHAL
ncbi:ABC transporter substrate-binding protein [Streptomyces sp. NPDC050560]|uniref:ABC transporter substrate-binding protein n=1 Tax=Streptomyces sp. NPDC050560 TaxID=3365630 RepID=UPI00379B622D